MFFCLHACCYLPLSSILFLGKFALFARAPPYFHLLPRPINLIRITPSLHILCPNQMRADVPLLTYDPARLSRSDSTHRSHALRCTKRGQERTTTTATSRSVLRVSATRPPLFSLQCKKAPLASQPDLPSPLPFTKTKLTSGRVRQGRFSAQFDLAFGAPMPHY